MMAHSCVAFEDSPSHESTVAVTAHTTIVTAVFTPQSREELGIAVDMCIKKSPDRNCTQGPNGPIWSWDVSRVTNM